jgi:adenylate kinase
MIRALLFVGPPGSGKGTQAKKLAFLADQYHLSSGDIFRAIPKDSPEGKLQSEYLSKGLLVPDEVTLQICLTYIDGLEKTFKFDRNKQLLLLDGFPRTKNQAELLKGKLDIQKVILLDVPQDEVLITRLEKRALIEGRADDAKRELLQKRFDVYKKQTAEVLSSYPKEKILPIHGDQTPLKVFHDILTGLLPLLG